MLDGVSFSGTSGLDITLGDSGGLETSGYFSGESALSASTVAFANNTAAFISTIGDQSAAYPYSGTIMFNLQQSSSYTWTCLGMLYAGSSSARMSMITGTKALSAELTQLSLSGGTFDAGAASIAYM